MLQDSSVLQQKDHESFPVETGRTSSSGVMIDQESTLFEVKTHLRHHATLPGQADNILGALVRTP